MLLKLNVCSNYRMVRAVNVSEKRALAERVDASLQLIESVFSLPYAFR